jgi:hypothetical protein
MSPERMCLLRSVFVTPVRKAEANESFENVETV